MGLVDSDYSYLADPDSINEIGCIHTVQGLDLQYVGVIIGKDLIYRDGKIQFDKNTQKSHSAGAAYPVDKNAHDNTAAPRGCGCVLFYI